MSDEFTEVSSQGWLSRIGSSIKGIFFGLILFVVGFPLLFWNEGRAVDRMQTLEEGGGAVISVGSDSVVPGNNGQLVHVSGLATTDETLQDVTFAVQALGLKLKRSVSMYQWKEEEDTQKQKELGGSEKTITTYRYEKTWSSQQIDSSGFKKSGYNNPHSMAHSSRSFQAKHITVGAFLLPESLVSKIDQYERLDVSANALPNGLGKAIQLLDGGYYMGNNPSQPDIGDLKVSFSVIRPTQVSLVAQQQDDSFQPYQTRVGGTINLLQGGMVNAQAMFEKAQDDNETLTWILRLVGFVVMAMGLAMVLKPLSVVADIVPFIGNIVGAGTGFIAFVLAAISALSTIAVAWIMYRPLIGGVLLLAVVGFIWMGKRKISSAASARTVTQAP